MGCEWKLTDSFWLCLRALNIFSKLFSCFPGTYGHLIDIVSRHNLGKWVCIVCFSHWSSQRNRVSVSDRLTALDCDRRSVERTLMAVFSWMPISLSVCVTFSSYFHGTHAHNHSQTVSVLNGCLSVRYDHMNTVNKRVVEMPRCSDFSFGSTSPPTNGGN